MELQFNSTKNYLDKMNYITGLRNDSLQKLPTFAEYNSTEQANRRKQSESKILDKFTQDFNSLYNSVEVDIKNLDKKIFKTKYPLLSNDASFSTEEALRLRGTLEYQNAIQYLDLISPDYPKQDIQEYYNQKRYDFVSALIDLSLRKQTQEDMYTQREDFIKSVNTLWEFMGVLDMMKEKLELQWVLEQLKIQYYSSTGVYDGESRKTLVQFGVMDRIASDNLQKAIAQLKLK